ncbi:MAG TPA: hypothetical protein VJ788_08310 [Gemmatimonadota bacterium]|nr:hypothetical protein [Gemmatimonadota bacterium]
MRGGRILGIAFAALATLALAAGSRVPWTASPETHALLRLSWRAPSVVAEQCRSLTEAEKAELPVHMQVPEVCESHAIPYVLEARIDGTEVPADTIHGAGARDDRPVVVFREIPLAVGSRTVEIAFRPIVDPRDADEGHDEMDRDDDGDSDDDESRDDDVDSDDDEDRGDDEAIALAYSETLRLGPREVALVTVDPERRTLIRVMPRER